MSSVALSLTEIASDRREPQERKDAQECLREVMLAPRWLEPGLLADYTEFCLRFLCEFDKADRDPALSVKALRQFAKGLRCLFIDGWIYSAEEGEDIPPSLQGGRPEKTLTQIVHEQLDELFGIYYGVWNDTSREAAAKTMAEIKTCVDDTTERLGADMVAKPTTRGLTPSTARWTPRPAASQAACAESGRTEKPVAAQTDAERTSLSVPRSTKIARVHTLLNLDATKIDLSTETLETWIVAIAYGHRVEEVSAAGVARSLQLAPAIETPPCHNYY